MATIKVKRGLKSSLPILAEGELGYTTDTNETYIGDGSTNYKFISENDIVTSISTPGSDSVIPSEQSVVEYIDANAGSGGLSWSIISTNQTLTAGNGYLADCSGGTLILDLPSSPSEGDQLAVCDYTGNSEINSITLSRSGNNIEGSATDLIINIDGAGITLVYSDATRGWEIVSKAAAGMQEIVEDSTPQLGGNLDLNGYSIAFPSITISDSLDEDNMASNSATALATQQSIKAYVDNHANNASAHHTRYALTEDLTSDEISQLQNIDTVTITNAQWGYLGSMSAQPVESSSEIDHGSVSGLGDDDHTQYLLANGTRDVGGDMNWTSGNAAQFGSTFEVKYNSTSNSLDFNYIG